jgi:hypothetical protein
MLAKLGLARYSEDKSFSAETTRRETRREQDRADASHRPRDVDPQTREEPPADPDS